MTFAAVYMCYSVKATKVGINGEKIDTKNSHNLLESWEIHH